MGSRNRGHSEDVAAAPISTQGTSECGTLAPTGNPVLAGSPGILEEFENST